MAKRRSGAPSPGEGFPGFHDVAPLHLGEHSQVYVAVETATSRPCALRVLDLSTLTDERRSAVVAIANRMGAVSTHPHVVTQFRSEQPDPLHLLLVLEQCPTSLADALSHAVPMPADTATALVVKLCGALETAHRHGVLHLDVCPGHVRFTPFGEPAVADLGLAHVAPLGRVKEEPSGFAALHAAPELIESPAGANPASDVYGLASVLFEAINGKPAFAAQPGEGAAMAILRAMRDPLPRVGAPGVPVLLVDLLYAAMAKEPTDRPASPLALAQQLQEVQRRLGWPVTDCAVLGAGPKLWDPVAPADGTAGWSGRDEAPTGGFAAQAAAFATTGTADPEPVSAPATVVLPVIDLDTVPVEAAADPHPLVAMREAGEQVRPIRRSDLFNPENISAAVVPLPSAEGPAPDPRATVEATLPLLPPDDLPPPPPPPVDPPPSGTVEYF